MENAITMNGLLTWFGAIVSIVALFKALEWCWDKLKAKFIKDQKIDNTSESFEEFRRRTDARLTEVEKKVEAGHKKAFESLGEMKDFINQAVSESNKQTLALLTENKKEYMEQIESVKEDITELKAEYQSKTAVIELQIANLEKKQDVHNNLISRVYGCEKSIEVHDEKIKVANHRLDDLEQDIKVGH